MNKLTLYPVGAQLLPTSNKTPEKFEALVFNPFVDADFQTTLGDELTGFRCELNTLALSLIAH